MRAVRVEKHGGPEVLRLQQIPTPSPDAGEALVEVAAAGVNFIDTYHRSGLYPLELPFTPGVEAAGVVKRVGPGVEEILAGDRVAYARGYRQRRICGLHTADGCALKQS